MTLPVKDFKQQKERPIRQPSNDERIKLDKVEKDFKSMINARQSIDKDWSLYNQMIEAIPRAYQDDRSTSTVPMASAIIELYVAEALKIPTEYIFKSETSKYRQAARLQETARKYDWRKNNRKEEIIEWEYYAAWFGHAVFRTWFEVETTQQYELKEIKADWSIEREKEDYTEEKIALECIDPRQFYLDNNASRWMKDAKKCMTRKIVWYDEFCELKNNPLYKNLEYVSPKTYTNERQSFTTQYENYRQWEFVEIREYWNLKGDIYLVWANGVIIREHHIMSTVKGRKVLPFTIRVLGKKNGSTYGGRGLCEMLIRFNSELNDLREMLMDWVRRSNNPTIAIGNWLSFNGRKFSFDNEILEFDGDISKWFAQLTGTPPNQAIFEYMNKLFEQIAIFVGIDIKNILGEPQQTAYQTNVQLEASQKRINVRLTNRDLAFERLANQHLSNLIRFFPRETAEWLFPELEIEDYDVVEDEDGQSIKRNKGSSWLIRITPELLDGDTYVDVHTNISKPPSDIADRQSKLEFVTAAWPILQLAAQAQQLGIKLPMEKRIEDLAVSYGLDMDMDSDWEEMNKMKAEFTQKLMSMVWQPPQEMEWQPQQNMQQSQAPSTQPNQQPNQPQNPQTNPFSNVFSSQWF